MPLHPGEVLMTEDRLARSSSWVTSFPLPHDNLGVGERGFGQVITQLHQLTGLRYQHAIGTFNTCSRVPTHWFLTDTGGSYNFGGASFPYHTPWPSQSTVLQFPPKGSTRSQVNHSTLPTGVKEDQTINLASGTLHPTSTISYHLRIACANGNPPRW
jgi:hypothetical protein